jgi:hypothetical protein
MVSVTEQLARDTTFWISFLALIVSLSALAMQWNEARRRKIQNIEVIFQPRHDNYVLGIVNRGGHQIVTAIGICHYEDSGHLVESERLDNSFLSLEQDAVHVKTDLFTSSPVISMKKSPSHAFYVETHKGKFFYSNRFNTTR